LASASALNGEKKKALQSLQKAVEKGFADRDAIVNNAGSTLSISITRLEQKFQRPKTKLPRPKIKASIYDITPSALRHLIHFSW
jgi:short-subunit dehydrogenase involved in D-alanine esterification of teichoic acids